MACFRAIPELQTNPDPKGIVSTLSERGSKVKGDHYHPLCLRGRCSLFPPWRVCLSAKTTTEQQNPGEVCLFVSLVSKLSSALGEASVKPEFSLSAVFFLASFSFLFNLLWWLTSVFSSCKHLGFSLNIRGRENS